MTCIYDLLTHTKCTCLCSYQALLVAFLCCAVHHPPYFHNMFISYMMHNQPMFVCCSAGDMHMLCSSIQCILVLVLIGRIAYVLVAYALDISDIYLLCTPLLSIYPYYAHPTCEAQSAHHPQFFSQGLMQISVLERLIIGRVPYTPVAYGLGIISDISLLCSPQFYIYSYYTYSILKAQSVHYVCLF